MLEIGFESSLLTSVSDFWLSGRVDSSTGGEFGVVCATACAAPNSATSHTRVTAISTLQCVLIGLPRRTYFAFQSRSFFNGGRLPRALSVAPLKRSARLT